MPVCVRIDGKPEGARARNLATALRMLGGGKGRFMARDWSGGL